MISPWMFAWLAREREFELRRELERLSREKEHRGMCREVSPELEIRGTILNAVRDWFRHRTEHYSASKSC